MDERLTIVADVLAGDSRHVLAHHGDRWVFVETWPWCEDGETGRVYNPAETFRVASFDDDEYTDEATARARFAAATEDSDVN